MVMCWAPECNHYNQRETCKFYKFPTNPTLRRKWINLVRRAIEPGPGAHLCSCHFKDGKKENMPTLFKHNKEKRFQFSSPEKKKRATIITDHILDPQSSSGKHAVTSLETTFSEAEAVEISTPQIEEPQAGPSQHTEEILSMVEEPLPELLEPQPGTSKDTSGVFSAVLVEAENYYLGQELLETTKKLKYAKSAMNFDQIKDNDKLVLLYTGLPNAVVFESILELLQDINIQYYFTWKVEKLTRPDQLLLTLMKLRHNFAHLDLAQRFNISQAAVSNIVITWVHVLHTALFKKLMAKIPDRKKNRSCLPNCCSTFTNCRIIIDCTEIYTVVPRESMATQKVTYSSYKHRNTWKGLVGVAPNGVITYLSGLYPGSTSDKKIVHHCGILQQLVPGDLVLADKGFLIRDILPPGVALNLPPFLTTTQFTPEQVQQTECIARARIHVERAIRRMKVYKILQFIPQTLRPYAQEVFQTVGALTNLQYPLIKEVEQYMSDDS